MKVYVAGIGLSDGGHFSLEVFSSEKKARNYVESLFQDSNLNREWSLEKVIDQDPNCGKLSLEGEQLYYGFEKDRKGFIKEREVEK